MSEITSTPVTELITAIAIEASLLCSPKLESLLREIYDRALKGSEPAIRWLLANIAPEDLPPLTDEEKALVA